jgi:hypothetical protein
MIKCFAFICRYSELAEGVNQNTGSYLPQHLVRSVWDMAVIAGKIKTQNIQPYLYFYVDDDLNFLEFC